MRGGLSVRASTGERRHFCRPAAGACQYLVCCWEACRLRQAGTRRGSAGGVLRAAAPAAAAHRPSAGSLAAARLKRPAPSGQPALCCAASAERLYWRRRIHAGPGAGVGAAVGAPTTCASGASCMAMVWRLGCCFLGEAAGRRWGPGGCGRGCRPCMRVHLKGGARTAAARQQHHAPPSTQPHPPCPPGCLRWGRAGRAPGRG